jgi:nucleotide-binding universal stress UspA family protein
MKDINVKKILVPVDFSSTSLTALEHAGHMARLANAELLLIHVLHHKWTAFSWDLPEVPGGSIHLQGQRALKQLGHLADNIQANYQVNVQSLCLTGHVAQTIVSTADSNNVDLIVMGTQGTSSGLEEIFIGSNAYRVVNQSNCPVLSIQGTAAKKGYQNILLPIDDSFYSLQKVNYAVMLAKQYGSHINLVGLAASDSPDEVHKIKIRLAQVEKHLRHHQLGFETRIRTGANYARLSMTAAYESNSDLIIIMTEWEEDITGLFIGPFARQVVNHSKIPVMSVRPEVKEELIPSRVAYY